MVISTATAKELILKTPGLLTTPEVGVSSAERERILNLINLYGILPLRAFLFVAYASNGAMAPAALMAAAFISVSLLVLLRHIGRLSYGVYRFTSQLFTLICPVLLTGMLGGFLASSMVIGWSLLSPILGLLLYERRTAERWFGLFIAGIVVNLALDWLIPPHRSVPNHGWQDNLTVVNIIGISTLLFLMLRWFFIRRQQVEQRLDLFASQVSHELRNPLATISLGISHAIRIDATDPSRENQRQILSLVQQEVSHCSELLSCLLDLSRSNGDGIRRNLVVLDVLSCCQNAVDACLDPCGGRLRLACDLADAERLAVAHPHYLTQSLRNLIENSCKFSPGSSSVEVTLDRIEGGLPLRIRVADHGIGIPEDELEKVFDHHYRASNSGRSHGSGLGLSLVKAMVETMGGRVRAANRCEGGTVITILLPAAPAGTPWPPSAGQA
ncbi:MAG: HAMP domain-containing histidine kinase [Synechococcus sp. Tobar2m-G35]|nr:HAMP domain-containing histidine kinase [Synechococcus sp. Tobar2m-G35]